MVSSRMQEPQRASGDKATVGRLLLLDLSDNRIVSLNPDGSDRKVIVTGCRYPDGIAVDVAARHMYWTNMGDLTANDGSGARSQQSRHVLDRSGRSAARQHGECPTTSRTFSTNNGSLDSFHESCLCGANPNARHTRDTVDCDIPRCSAIDRVDQCVASLGAVSNVAVINASIWACAQHQLSDVRSVSPWPGSVGGLMECMARQRVRMESAV
jgi:hypothetical protein